MKVLIQWTQADPKDWVEIDASDWSSQPRHAEPKSPREDFAQDSLGYIFDLNVQGVHFGGHDHYHVEPFQDGCKVTVWDDDPDEFPEGDKCARVWFFLPLAPDARLGGAINTRQWQHVYAQSKAMERLKTPLIGVNFYPWEEFIPPQGERHGVWVNDELYQRHVAARALHGWMEWTEHLPPHELDERGHLKEQRAQGRYSKALGTLTYYQRDTATHATIVGGTNVSKDLEPTTATSGTVTQTWTGNTTSGFFFTSATTEPNQDWPTGDYRMQINVAAVGADMTGFSIEMDRYDAPLTTQVDRASTSSPAVTTGLHLTTWASGSSPWNTGGSTPTGNTVTDRIVVELVVTQANNMKSETFTLTVNTTDSFIDGPWVPAAVFIAQPPVQVPPRGQQAVRRASYY